MKAKVKTDVSAVLPDSNSLPFMKKNQYSFSETFCLASNKSMKVLKP